MNNKLTDEQIRHICELHNEFNDVSTLEFILDNNLCNEKQHKELIELLYEARKEVSMRDNQKYQKRKEKFLNSFGIKFDYGHAYYKEETYTVVREYFKSVEIKAKSPADALNKAKATYAFDEVSSIDPIRTYVEGTEIED